MSFILISFAFSTSDVYLRSQELFESSSWDVTAFLYTKVSYPNLHSNECPLVIGVKQDSRLHLSNPCPLPPL